MKYIILTILLLISGCQSTNTCYKADIVKVPVIQSFPTPPLEQRPDLPLDNINYTDYSLYNKNMQITIRKLMDYSRKLELDLNVYRNTEASP